MASTFQLSLGSSGKLADVESHWLRHNNSSGFQVQVSHDVTKLKARHFSVCFTAPKTGWNDAADKCSAHTKAVGPSREEMSIASVNLVHTCGGDLQQKRRKRNCLTHDIAEVSGAMELCQPAFTKSGNTKQLISMTKAAVGLTMKKGQANRTV